MTTQKHPFGVMEGGTVSCLDLERSWHRDHEILDLLESGGLNDTISENHQTNPVTVAGPPRLHDLDDPLGTSFTHVHGEIHKDDAPTRRAEVDELDTLREVWAAGITTVNDHELRVERGCYVDKVVAKIGGSHVNTEGIEHIADGWDWLPDVGSIYRFHLSDCYPQAPPYKLRSSGVEHPGSSGSDPTISRRFDIESAFLLLLRMHID